MIIMKKIFYLTVFLLTFISCTSNYETTTTCTTIDHVKILNVEGYSRIKIIDIEHNGHDYIIFDCYETMGTMGIEHSPDCKKCKSK
jgi:hypothetical protein